MCSDSWDLQLPLWIKIYAIDVFDSVKKWDPKNLGQLKINHFCGQLFFFLDFKKSRESRDPNDSSTLKCLEMSIKNS